jgi:purine-cytosine permease-like protein
VQVVIAFIGHNLIQVWEHFTCLMVSAIVSVIASRHRAVSATTRFSANAVSPSAGFNLGGFTLAAGPAYGYTAGWTPFASDYTRYLPENTSKKALAWFAGTGKLGAPAC